nr:glucokinase [Burkholderia ubonensis]
MSEATLNGDPVARCAVPAAEPRLLADIGGTHARFALETTRGEIGNVRVYRCGDHASVADAMRAFLRDAGGARVRHAAIAIANPVDGDLEDVMNFAADKARCRDENPQALSERCKRRRMVVRSAVSGAGARRQ